MVQKQDYIPGAVNTAPSKEVLVWFVLVVLVFFGCS
jgi:hypothetical protein